MKTNQTKLILAQVLFVFHAMLTFFVIQFGFIFIPSKYALAAALFNIVVIAHWYLNDFNCIISDLEVGLRGEKLERVTNVYDSYSKGKSTHKFFNETLGLGLTGKQMHLVVMSILILNIVLLLVRWRAKYEVIDYSKIWQMFKR